MKKFFLCLIIFSKIHATAWVDQGPISQQSLVNNWLNMAYSPQLGYLFAAWAELPLGSQTNTFPKFSILESGTWTPVEQISNLEALNLFSHPNVFLAADSSTNVFAAWVSAIGPDTFYPFVAIYNGIGFGTPQSIPGNLQVYSDVFLGYKSGSNQMFATWQDNQLGGPAYSIYDQNSGSWSTGALIASGNAVQNVYTAYDTDTGALFAAWVDATTTLPMYSIYTTNSWSTPLPISPTVAQFNVDIAYNEAAHEMFAAWVSGFAPTYAIYTTLGGWSPDLPIPGATEAQNDVSLVYDPAGEQIFAAWASNSTYPYYPYFSIYSNGVWSPLGTIETSTDSYVDVTLAYYPIMCQIVAAWSPDFDVYSPFYAYTATYQTGCVNLPVTCLTGKQFVNDFRTVSERFNHLAWVPAATSWPRGFNVYRNGVLIATVPASQHSYNDNNRKKGVPDTYSVTSLGYMGESDPVTITVY